MAGRSREFAYYVSVGVGLAIANASFTMMSGMFRLTGGLWTCVAVALAGTGCLMVARCVGRLARMYPASSGLRTYLKVGLGNRASLVLIYLYVLFVVLVGGIESYMFALVVRTLWSGVSVTQVIAIVFAVVLIVNLYGLELPRSVQMASTGVLFIGLLTLAVAAILSEGAPARLLAATADSSQRALMIPAAAGMGFFLFVGFEWVTPLAFRRDSYETLIPRAMCWAVMVNTVLNVLFVAGLAGILTQQELVQDPIPQMALSRRIWGEAGRTLGLGLSALAIFSTFNAGLMGGARLLYTLAREGCFFPWCARVSLRNGVAYGSILFLSALATLASIVVVALKLYVAAAVIGSAIVCVVYSALILTLIRVQRERPGVLVLLLQWAGVIVLPALGAFALISEPDLGATPVVGLVACAGVASLLMWHFSRPRVQAAKSVAPARAGVH